MTSNDTQFKSPPTRFGPMLLAIGPAIVVSGSVIGSGELINVPVQAATFGFVLFWAVVLSCVIKYFLQVELGRHCLVHNRTTIQALNACPGPRFRGTGWIGILYMVGYTLSMATLGGIMGTTAGLLQNVFPLDWLGLGDSREEAQIIGKNIWGVVTFLVVALILWRGLYGELEKLIAILVAGFSLSIVVAVFLLVLFPDPRYPLSSSDLFLGMKFSLGDMDPQLAAFAVISLLGALGTTANELFMYPYWILEKGYARHLGPAESDGWLDRARGWLRVLRVDTGSATLLATLITGAYFLVGSAVLHQHGRAWLFTADDILDWPALSATLRDAKTQESASPSRRVWELLPEDVRDSLGQAAETANPQDKPDPGFIQALNDIVNRRDFYRDNDFRPVEELPDQAQRFLERDRESLSSQQVQRLNRLLLEASFPTEISTSVPSGFAVVKEISKIYTETYGQWSYGIFMFGGFCTLFSTLIVAAAATGRMWTDLLSSMGAFDWHNEQARTRCNRAFQTIYLIGFLALTLFMSRPEKLVILGQYINGLVNTPLIMFGICWIAFHTDRRLRMGRTTAVLLLTTVLIIVTCLVIGLYQQM